MRTVRARLAAGLVAGLAALLVTASPASAHDKLLSSDPSESGVLPALPSRAVLTFTGPVAEVHEITVTGPDGSVVNGDPTSVGPEVRQNLWAGPDGSYTMTYDVLSADGHEVAGEITFEVGQVGQVGESPVPAEDEGASSSSAPGSWSDGLVRGALVPMTVVLLSAAVALVLRHRRRMATTRP